MFSSFANYLNRKKRSNISISQKRSSSGNDRRKNIKSALCFRSRNKDDDVMDREKSIRNVYHRPEFLDLNNEENILSMDHKSRTIFAPKQEFMLPFNAGYAECLNGGKSVYNEDQSSCGIFTLKPPFPQASSASLEYYQIDVNYFCIYDGHGGTGASLMAVDEFIKHVQEKLSNIHEDLVELYLKESYCEIMSRPSSLESVNQGLELDNLVTGALESAFIEFDDYIVEEKSNFLIPGGCTALVVLLMLGRIYVANAGDCRAVAFYGDNILQLNEEYTPNTESERIRYKAKLVPQLLHDYFTELTFIRNVTHEDVGKQVLCSSPDRKGWFYKSVTIADSFKRPLVTGEGKWARLMGVIGVTRGFGDHNLRVACNDIPIKPFLSPVPGVQVFNLSKKKFADTDVLVMGSDGLWDVLTNEKAQEEIKRIFADCSSDFVNRYLTVAKQLVHYARGDLIGQFWRMGDNREASLDDISAFVIPLDTAQKLMSAGRNGIHIKRHSSILSLIDIFTG